MAKNVDKVNDKGALKAILIIKSELSSIKLIEFCLNLEDYISNSSKSTVLTLTNNQYRFILGNEKIVRDMRIDTNIPVIISHYKMIGLNNNELDDFLLPFIPDKKILNDIKLCVLIFSKNSK